MHIIRQNYFEGPPLPAEEIEEGYPSRDKDGCFYYAAYLVHGVIRGISNCFGLAEEAADQAATILRRPIDWNAEDTG